MVFVDLNVPYDDREAGRATAMEAFRCGYDVVALTHAVAGGPLRACDAADAAIPSADVAALAAHAARFAAARKGPFNRQTLPQRVPVLRRLTVALGEASHVHALAAALNSAAFRAYDVVAVCPGDERLLQQCCASVDADVVVLDPSARVLLKKPYAATAVARGVVFEVSVAPAVRCAELQRGLVGTAMMLADATGAGRRGAVLSCGALSPAEERGPRELVSVAMACGFTAEGAHAAVSAHPLKAIENGFTRSSTFHGVVSISPETFTQPPPPPPPAAAASAAPARAASGAPQAKRKKQQQQK